MDTKEGMGPNGCCGPEADYLFVLAANEWQRWWVRRAKFSAHWIGLTAVQDPIQSNSMMLCWASKSSSSGGCNSATTQTTFCATTKIAQLASLKSGKSQRGNAKRGVLTFPQGEEAHEATNVWYGCGSHLLLNWTMGGEEGGKAAN